MQKEIDPKVAIGVAGVVVIGIAVAMILHFRTPANFSGPPVQIKAPLGFKVGSPPGVRNAKGGGAATPPPPTVSANKSGP